MSFGAISTVYCDKGWHRSLLIVRLLAYDRCSRLSRRLRLRCPSEVSTSRRSEPVLLKTPSKDESKTVFLVHPEAEPELLPQYSRLRMAQ
jgi:hypothetical protein